MKIFVLIPGYNEEKYLDIVLKKVRSITSNVVYIDDGSTDASSKIAEKYTKNVLIHPTNLGKGAALKTGCEYAFKNLDADAVVFMDADNQHDAGELPNFFKHLEKGVDVVFGVRKFSSNMPMFRFLGNKFESIFLNILFHGYIPDIPSGYKAMTKHAYKKLHWNSSGYEVETEIAMNTLKHKIPFSVIEIETIYHDTDKGMNLLDAFLVALRLIQWRIGV